MILLDTNVLIFAFDPDLPFYKWARDAIAGDPGALRRRLPDL